MIVVIAVLGTLVLLAMPNFLNFTEKAKVAQVKSDIVAFEKTIEQHRIDEGEQFIENWSEIDSPSMDSLKGHMQNEDSPTYQFCEAKSLEVGVFLPQNDKRQVS